jgi:hypothetical protein
MPTPVVMAAAQLVQQNVMPSRVTSVVVSTIGIWQCAQAGTPVWPARSIDVEAQLLQQ